MNMIWIMPVKKPEVSRQKYSGTDV